MLTGGGAAAAAELRARVTERLSQSSMLLGPVGDAGFVSAVCLSLNADFRAHAVRILMEQWFLVVVEQLLDSNEERQVVVQADAVEDGLAAVWEYLAKA